MLDETTMSAFPGCNLTETLSTFDAGQEVFSNPPSRQVAQADTIDQGPHALCDASRQTTYASECCRRLRGSPRFAPVRSTRLVSCARHQVNSAACPIHFAPGDISIPSAHRG